ncbi:MAG: DUF5706 domain-containing protein [Syntrophorhabdaceae bacterium]|nr:DUF5706 domain-containing protein [Syntrophorhabdaceae bacterium]
MNVQDDLRFICSTIESSLRYAESKHAAFVAFNGLATFGGFGLLRNLNISSTGWVAHIMLSLAVGLLICAILTSMYSFIPVIIREKKTDVAPASDNILFFEHVKHHSVESYEQLLCELYQVSPESITPLDRCVISQIIVNAYLTSRKFALFKRVAMLDIAAVAFVLIGIVLVLIRST